MIPQKFELHLAQAESLLNKVSSLRFENNPKKKNHFEQLKDFFQKIKKADYYSFKSEDLDKARQCIDYFLLWDLEFLSHSSDTSVVPNELIFCIEKVLKEWIDKSDEYIIVTSLSSKFISYSFQSIPDDKLTILEPFLNAKFGITFKHKLLLINMPEPLTGDYLANVILFHEIGHFIDRKLRIIDLLFDKESGLKRLENSANPNDRLLFQQAKHHYREFFSDLFAAQYIGDSCSCYINYIAHKQRQVFTHPGTDSRIAIVQNFLNDDKNEIIDTIQKYINERTDKYLQKRFVEITGQYEKDVMLSVSNNAELYSLFIKGWECWLNTKNDFPRKLSSGLLDGYEQLNDLIRKSIREFMDAENQKSEAK